MKKSKKICLEEEFHKLKKKKDMAQDQKVAIAMNVCEIPKPEVDCPSCVAGEEKMHSKPESLSDCFKRNGINLEKDHHVFKEGSFVKGHSGKKYKVHSFDTTGVKLAEVFDFGTERIEPETKVSYNELIDKFKNGSITVDGFSPEEVMEFSRVINTIHHCAQMEAMVIENERLKQPIIHNQGSESKMAIDHEGKTVSVGTTYSHSAYGKSRVMSIKKNDSGDKEEEIPYFVEFEHGPNFRNVTTQGLSGFVTSIKESDNKLKDLEFLLSITANKADKKKIQAEIKKLKK